MRTHPARLSNAGITPARYEELRAICRQYRWMKRAMDRARAGIVDRPEGKSGAWHRPDPTGSAAISLAGHPYAKRMKQIEESAAKVAEPVVAAALLRNVTEGWSYEHLRPPCGEKQFYVIRQLFYIELDRRLWEEP